MMKRKAAFLTVALTILTLSLSACGSSAPAGSSSGGGSSSAAGSSQAPQAETTGTGTDNNTPQASFSGAPRPSDMTASNDLAPYIRKSLGDILKAFPEFTQLEGGEKHPAYGNDSLWFAFVMRDGEFVCDYIKVRGENTPYSIYGIYPIKPSGDNGWRDLMDEMMAKGFDEGGSGELLDSESNCLYIGGLYDDDLPYVSLYAYDL